MDAPLTYIASLACFGSAFFAYLKVNKLRKLEKEAQVTTADITRKEVLDGKYGAYRYWLHYAFDHENHRIPGKAEVSLATYDHTPDNGHIEVMYDRYNPKISYLQQIFRDRLSSYQALVLILVVSGVVMPLVF